MAEHSRISSSAGSDLDARKTQTSLLPQSGASSTSAILSPSAEHAPEGAPKSALEAAAAAGRRPPIDSTQKERHNPMQSMHQGSSGPRPLPRNAGSTKQVHVAASPAPTQETERASTSTDASPPRASSVREVVNERPALPVADTANLSQQRSEQSSDIAPAHVPDEKDEATAAAEQRQPCSPGSSVAPRKFGDSSTVFESAVVPEVAGQVAISSPPRESSGSTKEMQATAVAQLGVGVQASSVEPCSLQASSWLDPAAEEPEDEKEDDSYRDEYEHITGGGWWDDETENHGFEYDGEQEQEETSEKTEENKQKEEGGGGLESSDWEEANEHAPEETMEDAADEAKEGGIAPEGQSTYHMSHDFHSSQRLAEDCLSELAMPTGTVAQVLVETPPNEEAQHATAAVHQQRECSEATGGGEKHENTQAPLPTVVPTGPDIQLVTVSGIMGNVAEPLAGTVPRTAATTVVSTIEQTGMGIQATSGYQRRSSYMPGQAVRPARSAARASIQLALPPIFAEEGPASGCDASSIDATQTSQAGAGVEAEESGQPVEGWEEYHKLNPGRQHSTPNLVSIRSRAMERRRSLELFESGDSDDSSTSSSSSSSGDEAGANKPEERKDKFDEDPLKWQQSEEGKSRIAQLTKATVRVESPATKISRKYLKLFAPSNSAHDTYKVLATIHRRMNGTGWPRRGGWGSYLVRRSRAELDEGRVYGIKSNAGSVELVVLSSNNVCGRIPPIIARLESLKCINLSDNHISGPIPVELGLLLQLQTLQLQGNNLRDNISPLLGSLISLIRLSLGHNKLSGPLPDSLGNLIHLKYFSAEHNRLTGPIPSYMCHMTALENFNVCNNELSGVIPDKIGVLTRLKKLDFASNQFSGEIPASLGSLSALNWLRLDHNQISGPVPASFGGLKELLILNLSFNRLSGPLPTALATLLNLTTVSLRGNLFGGPFQFRVKFELWFSGVSGMRTLDLGSNEVEAPFPEMPGMRQLQSLVLDNNQIYDRLGEGLAETCPNLFKLHLQNNRLAGEIPHSLGRLTKLEVLDLSNNCFDGSLPPSMESLRLLNTFSASNNELSGELPSFVGGLTLLTCLALDGNQFNGSMPRELGTLTLLKRLYLERNELVGSIPKELSKCICLEELYLHDNKLWGKIPDSLRPLRELRYLYLHRNKFTGTVPEWLGELSRLRGLLLGENRLRGHIPWQLGHLHKLQDLYLNDNNLDGGIPERMVVNCERLQRLYLGGNHLTGTVPRALRHVRDLRELNIERNNFHGELPIPLFLKTSLGPNACGLKWGGNPRIVDSRHHFASTVTGIRRAEPEMNALSSELQDQQQHHQGQGQGQSRNSSFKPIRLTLVLPDRKRFSRSRGPSTSHGYRGVAAGLCSARGNLRENGSISMSEHQQQQLHLKEFDSEVGIEAMEDGYGEFGDDRGGVGRPWANSEDVCYFLLKVIAGNALVLIDFAIAARLYMIGCVWGCVLVMLWKAMAGFEGVLATRRLGYGRWWLPMSAFGLALTWQARICFHHSCESDLFQALQQVEWRWHAMIQLSTQLTVALSYWGSGQVGYWRLLVSLGTKVLVVGIVSMQRLDDKRLLRDRERRSASPKIGSSPSIFRHRFLPWLRDSACPRLILVGFHVAEVCERTIPLAFLIAALGDLVFLAPLAMAPGMFARYVARRPRTSRPGGYGAAVKSALKLSLALDSAFGAGTPGHVYAAISTTVEAIVFTTMASKAPQEYPDKFHEYLICFLSVMFVFTWTVVVLEVAIPVGRERGPPLRLPPPPSPRLLLRRFAAFSRCFSSSRSKNTPKTIHVQPSTSSLVMPRANGSNSSSESETIEDGHQKPGWRGGERGVASVVPIEG